jgi:hypothetical protein
MAVETPTWIYKSEGDKQTASEMNQLAQAVITNATELSNTKDDVANLSNNVTDFDNRLTAVEESETIKKVEEDKPIVPVSITGTWTISGGGTSTSDNLILENGYSVSWSGSFKWNSSTGCKNPERTDGDLGSTLPFDGQNSNTTNITGITSNRSITQNLYADKKGLLINGEKVVNATGEDKSYKSVSVTFKHNLFRGYVTNPTPTGEQVSALTGELVTSKAKTVPGVTTIAGQYYVYAYPQALGNLTSIIQNGSIPVLSAFNKTNVTYTNAAGLSITLNVYTSANDGAFTNATLNFQ